MGAKEMSMEEAFSQLDGIVGRLESGEASLEEAFQMPGGKEYYWDDVPLKVFKEHYSIAVRPCLEGDIIELDTVKELETEDPDYRG